MSRTVSLVALLQVAVIVLGLFALGATLKVNGYPDTFYSTIRWDSTAVCLREHGAWLLSLPASWVVFATVAQRRNVATTASSRTASPSSLELPSPL